MFNVIKNISINCILVPGCCKSTTVDCLSCSANVTAEEYCILNPSMFGCRKGEWSYFSTDEFKHRIKSLILSIFINITSKIVTSTNGWVPHQKYSHGSVIHKTSGHRGISCFKRTSKYKGKYITIIIAYNSSINK